MNSQSQTIFNKTQLIELIVQAGSTAGVFNFTPQPFLYDKNVISLEIFSSNDISLSPQGLPLMNSVDMSKAYLNLYYVDDFGGGGIWNNSIPLWDLHRIINGVDPYVRDLFGFNKYSPQWEKSNITLPTAPTNGVRSSFLLQVGYIDPQD